MAGKWSGGGRFAVGSRRAPEHLHGSVLWKGVLLCCRRLANVVSFLLALLGDTLVSFSFPSFLVSTSYFSSLDARYTHQSEHVTLSSINRIDVSSTQLKLLLPP